MQEKQGKRITIETEQVLVIARRRTVVGQSAECSHDMEALQAEAAHLFAMAQLQPPGQGTLRRGPARVLGSCLKSLLRRFRSDRNGRDSSDLPRGDNEV